MKKYGDPFYPCACTQSCRLRNLDSYENGRSSVEGDTQYGENTYTLVKISTENFEKEYLVTYAAER